MWASGLITVYITFTLDSTAPTTAAFGFTCAGRASASVVAFVATFVDASTHTAATSLSSSIVSCSSTTRLSHSGCLCCRSCCCRWCCGLLMARLSHCGCLCCRRLDSVWPPRDINWKSSVELPTLHKARLPPLEVDTISTHNRWRLSCCRRL